METHVGTSAVGPVSENSKLLAAKVRKDVARARVLEGVGALRAHFTGSAIADRAMGQVQRAVGRRPTTLATVVGSAGLFLLRRPLLNWLSARTKKRSATRKGKMS